MPRRLPAIVVPLLLALACSPEPHERPIPTDSSLWKTDPDFKKAVDALPVSERRLLEGWLMRHSFKVGEGDAIPERTIAAAIEEQRKFNAEHEKKKAAEKAAEKAAP
jgi:hypothetical protein